MAFRGLKRDPECRRSRLVLLPQLWSPDSGDVLFFGCLGFSCLRHPHVNTSQTSSSARCCRSAKEIKPTNARWDVFLPGGRVGRVCPDRPGLQPTTIRPGAADPHRLQDSPSASCQRRALSAGPSDGPRISTGTDEMASVFEF